jgi:hypothetical protein
VRVTTLRSRPCAGPADLPGLRALWPGCRPAAWQTDFPSPTDLAELLAAPDAAARIRVWEDAGGLVQGRTEAAGDRGAAVARSTPSSGRRCRSRCRATDEPIVCVAVAEKGAKLLLILEFHRPQ